MPELSNSEPFIMTSADDAWETLAFGESLLVKGRLERHAVQSISISFADWSEVILTCSSSASIPIERRSDVTVRAVRAEDGLRAIAVWTPGGVPIPC